MVAEGRECDGKSVVSMPFPIWKESTRLRIKLTKGLE